MLAPAEAEVAEEQPIAVEEHVVRLDIAVAKRPDPKPHRSSAPATLPFAQPEFKFVAHPEFKLIWIMIMIMI